MQHIALPFACESTHENKSNPHNNAIIGILEDATYRMQSSNMETQRGQIKKALKGRVLDASPSNMILENIKKIKGTKVR